MEPRLASQELPRKRVVSVVERISHASIRKTACVGFLLYFVPIVVFTVIEVCSSLAGNPLVYAGDVPARLTELPYFNLITIITIRYGDLSPVGLGRFLSSVEGVLGVGIFGLFVSVLTLKFLSPRHDSVVFSRWAQYCTDDERFLLIFVNTTNTYMFNVDMTSYFKLGGDWRVRPPIRTPFLTTSVQTFYLDSEPLQDIVALLRKGDAFRFGLSGSLGVSAYSTAVEYASSRIIVIPNRDELVDYQGFHSPDFRSHDISEMFHYQPLESLTLADYVARKRQQGV